MKIGIYGRSFNKDFAKQIKTLFRKLKEAGVYVSLYEPFYEFMAEEIKFQPQVDTLFIKPDQITPDFDFMFSIGGDGSFLHSMYFVGDKQIPIVGINCGRLGFLAIISPDAISDAIDELLAGKYSVENRSLIELKTANNLFGNFRFALNDLTIHKKDSSSMITLHVYMDGEFLNTYWGDGLIISTATGSTAYSLSAGGPIVLPDSETFILTPLAPHNLTVRPIVVPDKVELILKAEGRSSHYMATLDSRCESFDANIVLKVQRASFKIKTVKLKDHNFFSTLRNKMMWGLDKRNY